MPKGAEQTMRPMREAPKDGTTIILMDSEYGDAVIARWMREAWDTGFSSEVDGDRLTVEMAEGWYPVPKSETATQ